MSGWSTLVTAEHGGNEVPSEYQALFEGHDELLSSHRGWDPGTLPLAERIAGACGAPLVAARITRLLVDLNRSPGHRSLFSEITRPLPRAERDGLLARFHRPHWDAVRAAVAKGLEGGGGVVHLGIHSFTPVLGGHERKPDVAILYDPRRPAERRFAAAWVTALRRVIRESIVRRNDPYRGANDGLTTVIRREQPGDRYLGIEIEVNQKHVRPDGCFPDWVGDGLLATLPEAVGVLE